MAHNAIEEYVDAFRVAQQYVETVRNGNEALTELQRVRDIVVAVLADIQASNAYDTAIKEAAQEMAVALRQAILDFAATL